MYVKVDAKPDAKKEKVLKESDQAYRIEVKEPASRNLANGRVRELLSIELGLDKKQVRLISGHRSFRKIFSIEKKLKS